MSKFKTRYQLLGCRIKQIKTATNDKLYIAIHQKDPEKQSENVKFTMFTEDRVICEFDEPIDRKKFDYIYAPVFTDRYLLLVLSEYSVKSVMNTLELYGNSAITICMYDFEKDTLFRQIMAYKRIGIMLIFHEADMRYVNLIQPKYAYKYVLNIHGKDIENYNREGYFYPKYILHNGKYVAIISKGKKGKIPPYKTNRRLAEVNIYNRDAKLIFSHIASENKVIYLDDDSISLTERASLVINTDIEDIYLNMDGTLIRWNKKNKEFKRR